MNKLPKLIITILCLTIFSTSNVFASCYKDHDKFKGTTYQWCGAWGTEGTMLGGLNGLDPIPYHIKLKNGTENWEIKLVSSQKSWSNFKQGDQLVFLIDDELVEIAINVTSAKDIDSTNEFTGVRAVEHVFIPSSQEFFQKLASAKHVEFAVYSDSSRQERTIHASALEHYQDLINKVTGKSKKKKKKKKRRN